MRKDKLYFLTFISISVIFIIIASISTRYFIKLSANQLIELQLKSSERESKEISQLLFYQFEEGLDKKNIIHNLQLTIQNKNEEISFISVFDWSGIQVCHPDITKIGQEINSDQSLLNFLKEDSYSSDHLYDLLTLPEATVKNSIEINSEIIYTQPINNSDLIVASNINLDLLRKEITKLERSFYLIFILMGILIIGSSFFAVRTIGSYYEKPLELKNSSLNTELINLSKLNTDLTAYQQKLIKNNTEHIQAETMESLADSNKKRLLTYIRNELVPIHINKIAYIYTENTITYVISNTGTKSTLNLSLDDLGNKLEPSLFFRANRQFIISISSINKIIKYGNNQLKILVKDTDAEIIISKNKAAEFRLWLDI
jgi:DNA-binding LytR/AlgR family response regulator